jgi:hypothetical protein
MYSTALLAKGKTGRTFFQVLDVAAGEGDADFVELCGGHGAGSIVIFFALSDVTHVRDSGDLEGLYQRLDDGGRLRFVWL